MRIAIRTVLLATFATVICQPLRAADDAAKAQKLIDRAIKVMGGNKALEKSRNTIVEDEGTYFGMGEGVPYKGRYVFSIADPGRHRMRFEIVGQFVSVTDGDKAWNSVMGNTTDLDGEALEAAKQNALVNYAMSLIPLQKRNRAFKLSLAEPETVDGEECEGINIDHEKMPTITVHFGKKTGLIKKMKHVNKAAELDFKEVVEEAIFDEYKEFDGFKSATKITFFRDGKKYVESKPQKVTYPATIDESEFKKPE
ncbi:MAG: hypothetical protein ACYTG0_34805 [Planctomycetota bacterium]|jgi:hypothetical protein